MSDITIRLDIEDIVHLVRDLSDSASNMKDMVFEGPYDRTLLNVDIHLDEIESLIRNVRLATTAYRVYNEMKGTQINQADL